MKYKKLPYVYGWRLREKEINCGANKLVFTKTTEKFTNNREPLTPDEYYKCYQVFVENQDGSAVLMFRDIEKDKVLEFFESFGEEKF